MWHTPFQCVRQYGKKSANTEKREPIALPLFYLNLFLMHNADCAKGQDIRYSYKRRNGTIKFIMGEIG